MPEPQYGIDDALIQSGLDISSVITHRFHYTEFQQGFEVACSGQCGKVLLVWKDE